MTLVRRKILHLALGAAALPALARRACAQAYPSRPVRVMVGFPAGSSADIIARIMCQWLGDRVGQPFVVENRPGAGANIATDAVVRAPADGYSLLWVSASNPISTALYDNLSFDFLRDIAAVAGVTRAPLVMEVNPSVPARTISEFISYARANSGKINMASGGNGTVLHAAGELFSMMAGVHMIHVPYRGDGPALTDLIAGQAQVMFGPLAASIEHVKAGRLRALGVTTAARTEVLPDVPSVGDVLPGYEASGWLGLGAPRNTPAEIVQRLNSEINAGLTDPGIKARFANLGVMTFPGSSADFGKFFADETEKWAKVVRTAKMRPD